MIALDFILERKRLDDLVESIKDGRFREQKVGLENVLRQATAHVNIVSVEQMRHFAHFLSGGGV